MQHNLRRGAASTRASVQALICLLTRNNPTATETLNTLLYSRLNGALAGGEEGGLAPVRHEVTLLAALVRQRDACWESRLRTVIRLFLAAAKRGNSPAVMDAFTLPCLKILQDVVQSGAAPPAAPRKKDKEKSGSPEVETALQPARPAVDIRAWLAEEFSFAEWKDQFERANSRQVVSKYFVRWKSGAAERKWARAYGGLEAMRDRSHLKRILVSSN